MRRGGVSWQIELQEKLKIRRKTKRKKKKSTGGGGRRGGVEGNLHGVGGADGFPEDGVGPADLLAEPAQRVPHRHPGDAGRVSEWEERER